MVTAMRTRNLFSTPPRRAAWIFGAALALRVIYMLQVFDTACLDINLDPISDMETFHRWGLSIAEGDWLGRSDFHPFHPWQSAIAPVEQWDAWYGHTYHQEPFYPYLIAIAYLLFPSQPLSVILLQHLAGAMGCAAIYLAARRLGGERTALWAGGLAAVYGPFLFYESLLLRDTFLIPLHSVMLWVLVEARIKGRDEHKNGHAWAWWLAGGALIGVSYITKASILPFFFLFAVLTFIDAGPGRIGHRLRPALLMSVGFLAILFPVIVRNVVVGADVFKTTTRGPVEFVNGNNPWHMGTGWFDGDDARVSNYVREVLTDADGRLLPTMGRVLGDWSDNPAGYFGLQIRKLGYFFAPYEMPNNASYSYFRLRVPLLGRLLPSFFLMAPLVLIGAVASWKERRHFVPLYLLLSTGIVVTVGFYVIARFRAPLMPALLILAGTGMHRLIEQLREGKTRNLVISASLVAGVLLLNMRSNYPDCQLVRPQDYIIAIEGLERRRMVEETLAQAEEARAIFPDFAVFHRKAGFLYRDLGRRQEAIDALRTALDVGPADSEVLRELSRLERGSPP